MRGRAEVDRKPLGYAFAFTSTAIVLGGLTLVLVLVILPRRYVLHAGLRESGASFPASAPAFAPTPGVKRTAVSRPAPATVAGPGPGERFWAEILPLLREARYDEALPLFDSYLRDHATDRGVRRERAITLERAGRSGLAAAAYAELLREGDDPDVRLLYARSLRDQGRLTEADEQYRLLRRQRPDDVALAMESARALAWGRRFEAAAEILVATLTSHPGEEDVRVELARVYYWAGRSGDADRVLAGMSPDDVAALGAEQLREDVLAAVASPPAEEAKEPSLAQRAERALGDGEYRAAADLYRRALETAPADTALLRAYADVLQYRLEDPEGARASLLRLEQIRGEDPILAFRIAQLEVWTGRNGEATLRLERLLRAPDDAGPPEDRQSASEARALLGDLYRWAGHRLLSAEAYQRALADDPANEDAQRGLETLRADVERQVVEAERPRLGTDLYSFSDTDEFTRLDLALEAVTMDGSWVVGARSGSRIVRGGGLDGMAGSERGLFADVEIGRWWRLGTLRTAVRLGMERVRPAGTDATFDATLRFENLGSFRTDVAFHRGPAYPLTVTLSSLMANVGMDRLTLAAARRLRGRWSLAVSGDAALLRAPDAAAWPSAGTNLRLEGGLSLGRAFSDAWTVGVSGRALTYTDPAPLSDGRRLFWDPEAVFALGVYGQWIRSLGSTWEMSGRLAPSLALIAERSGDGFDRVPHLSAEGGLTRRFGGVRTKLDVFYSQGRFDGYRAYGARLGVSTAEHFGGGGR
jgi:tetratricopeptide (TPR) repeat protein